MCDQNVLVNGLVLKRERIMILLIPVSKLDITASDNFNDTRRDLFGKLLDSFPDWDEIEQFDWRSRRLCCPKLL